MRAAEHDRIRTRLQQRPQTPVHDLFRLRPFQLPRLDHLHKAAADGLDEDKVMEAALEAGAEDVVSEDGGFTVKCQCSDFTTVLDAIKAAGIAVDEENSSERTLIPNMTAPVSDVAVAKAINKFTDMLEDLEDVMETTDEVDAALEAEG